MQVFQTAGEPPSNGNNNLPNNGCTINISDALVNKVPANNKISASWRSFVVFGELFMALAVNSKLLMIKHLTVNTMVSVNLTR